MELSIDGLYSGLIGMLLSGTAQAGGSVVNAALRDAPVSNRTAGQYRADLPRNVDLPTVPIINLSMQSVADLNGGTLPQTGNALRKNAIDRARARLGLDENSAAYIPASNVLRNGEEYVLKITPSSLKKMLSPADGNAVQIESIAILDNIERIANNGVWFDSQGDRKNRTQINGIDHLKTTVYIDNAPYEVDMRVRLVQENPQAQTENVLYYYTPEEVVSIKKVGTTPPTDERRALIGASEGVPTLPTSVPHSAQSVNEQKLHIAPPQKSELIQEGYRRLKSGQMVSDELLSAMGVTQRQAKSIVNAARTNTSTPVSTTSQADYTPYLEQLKQAQRNKKVRELQDAYQKFLESEQSMQIVQMKDNSKRIEKSVQEPYNNFKTTDDPMREVAGAGEKSHPQEIARIKKELEKTGAEVEYRDNAMCYQPGLVSGRPGRFVIDRNASYSAWIHEYTHFLDDQKDGFLGFKVLMDLQRCIQREINAYNVEIELAKKENRQDIVDRLEALKKKEIARYESNAKDD